MSDDEDNWTIDLETSLIEGCDFGTLKNICKGRPVPSHLRAEVWQICLNVYEKGDPLVAFDELYDMDEQSLLREDCQTLVDKLGNDEEEKLSVASDIESILTFYCKSRSVKYIKDNGWLDILQPMLALKMKRADLYNCFYAFSNKYIPRDCVKNGKPFHLFRLLLLYHDPELCSFLDSKKITPDLYAMSWFQSMFSSTCDLNVTLNMWDVCTLEADPFLVFFLALVILVNAKDQIMLETNKADIIEKIATFPGALQAEDIEDFCQLAQYYASKTPQSFRKDYQQPLYGTTLAAQKEDSTDVQVSQALCLPVSMTELLQGNINMGEDQVRYFVVDCRPAEQYNAGHLPTAFHLDANLMLQNPEEFATAVQALFAAQRMAIATESAASGEHLCFMGSGREEEDQYVNMVVAHFLQRNSQYVSVARGGYSMLHQSITGNLNEGLADHFPKLCIVCSPEMGAGDSGVHNEEYRQKIMEEESLIDKFGKLSSVVKTKSAGWKDKMINYIKNEGAASDRHVRSNDRGKRYRNAGSVFTIGDDEEEDVADVPSSDDERRDVVNIETWLAKPEVQCAFDCQEVKANGYTYQSHLLVTKTHLYILREIGSSQKGMAWIQGRRALGSIVKITSKKKHPQLITFKYGSDDESGGLRITDVDRFIIPQASQATRLIKEQIMKVLDALDS